jgi:hypothetical protein
LYHTNLSIAGIPIDIRINEEKIFHSITKHYQDFRTSTPGDFQISFEVINGTANLNTALSLEENHVIFNNPGLKGEINIKQAIGNLIIAVGQSFEAVDYCLRVACSLLVFQRGGLMIHAAGIIHDQKGYLFAGRSGAGKTTISKVSKDRVVLNDDLVVIIKENLGWRVYSTPFWNPTQVKPSNGNSLLAKVLFLVQDFKVFLESMSFGSALAGLISSIPILTTNSCLGDELLIRCSEVLTVTEYFRLHFLPDDSFWDLIQ